MSSGSENTTHRIAMYLHISGIWNGMLSSLIMFSLRSVCSILHSARWYALCKEWLLSINKKTLALLHIFQHFHSSLRAGVDMCLWTFCITRWAVRSLSRFIKPLHYRAECYGESKVAQGIYLHSLLLGNNTFFTITIATILFFCSVLSLGFVNFPNS